MHTFSIASRFRFSNRINVCTMYIQQYINNDCWNLYLLEIQISALTFTVLFYSISLTLFHVWAFSWSLFRLQTFLLKFPEFLVFKRQFYRKRWCSDHTLVTITHLTHTCNIVRIVTWIQTRTQFGSMSINRCSCTIVP